MASSYQRTGGAAKEMLAICAVDCLIMDYRMPDARGDVIFSRRN